MKKIYLIFAVVSIIFSTFTLLIASFFYTIFPDFSLMNFKANSSEEYSEITNVKSDFLPLSQSEKSLISNGNKIISAIEKYYSEAGNYPESLETLVPDYIYEIPKTNYKRTHLLKIENAVYQYSLVFIKDAPELTEFYIGVRYGTFDEWYYSSRTKLWEWENH